MNRRVALFLFAVILLLAGRVNAQSCSGPGTCPLGEQCLGIGATQQCWMPSVNCMGEGDEDTCVLETMTQENFDDLAGPLLLAFAVAAGFRFIRSQILNRR